MDQEDRRLIADEVRMAVNAEMHAAVDAVQKHAEELAKAKSAHDDEMTRAAFENMAAHIGYANDEATRRHKQMSAVSLLLTILSGAGIGVSLAAYRQSKAAARLARKAAKQNSGNSVSIDQIKEMHSHLSRLIEEEEEEEA